MKRVFSLTLITMIVLIGGCIFNSDDDKDDKNDVEQSAETYLPFKTGSIWEYNDTETDHSQIPPEVHTSTSSLTCTGEETINGITYWAMKANDEDKSVYFRIQDNDVYTYNMEFFSFPIVTKSAQEINDEVLIFRFGVEEGTNWEILTFSGTFEAVAYSFSVTGLYVGMKNVSVPSGSYNDCAQFDIITTATYNYDGIDMTLSFTSSMWLAPNVGPVKMYDKESQMGIMYYEDESLLSSYTP